MQKEIEILQPSQTKITQISLNFVDFVKQVEYNVQKSLISRRNRELMRQRNKDYWLFKSKIIPPTFGKIGRENKPPHPKMLIPPPSVFNCSQTCQVTELDISTIIIQPKVHSSLQKQSRRYCKTSYEGLRKDGSFNRIKSSWKVQFRRDELNVLQFQNKKNDDQTSEWIERSNSHKLFKVRKTHKKFEDIKPKSYKIYKTNLQIEEKNPNISNGPQRTTESSSVYRYKSPQ